MSLARILTLFFVLAIMPLGWIALERDRAAPAPPPWPSIDVGPTSDFRVDHGPLADPAALIAPDAAPFRPADGVAPSVGMLYFSNGKLWMRFVAPDPGGTDAQLVVRIKDWRPRDARMVVVTTDGRILTQDWSIMSAERRGGLGLIPAAFTVDRRDLVGATVYVGWSSYGAMIGHVYLETRDAFAAGQMRAALWLGLLNGANFAIGVYLFVIGLRMRETAMLWAGAFAAQMGLRNLGAAGALHGAVFVAYPRLADTLIYGLQVVPVALWLVFLVHWLELKRHHPRWAKVLILGAAIIPLQGILIILKGGFGWNIPLNLSAAFPTLFGMLLGVVFLVYRSFVGDRRAQLYLLCWAPMATGFLTRIHNYLRPGNEIPMGPFAEPGADVVLTMTAVAVLLTLTFRDRESRLQAIAISNEQRIRDYAAVAGQSVIEIDPAGRILHAIGPLAQSQGLTEGKNAAESLGVPLTALGQPGSLEVERHGTWLSLTVTPMGGTSLASPSSRVIFSDVTASVLARKTEDRRNTLAALGQLAGSIAHEVNNLLHPLINLTRWVQKTEPVSAEGQKYLDMVASSGIRAGEIVSQVLQGYSPHGLHAPRVPLSRAVENAVETLRASLPATLSLHVDLAPVDQPNVSSGEALQLLANLVSNSLRAMNGTGDIWITLVEAKGDGTGARLVLRDNGPGIDPALLQTVTELYVTGSAAQGGSGIGLAMVAKIAENWGAKLQIQSAPGAGTEVMLTWAGTGPEGGE